eukprot:1332662-Amorphochlora_amoeboformis.AAC.1
MSITGSVILGDISANNFWSFVRTVRSYKYSVRAGMTFDGFRVRISAGLGLEHGQLRLGSGLNFGYNVAVMLVDSHAYAAH